MGNELSQPARDEDPLGAPSNSYWRKRLSEETWKLREALLDGDEQTVHTLLGIDAAKLDDPPAIVPQPPNRGEQISTDEHATSLCSRWCGCFLACPPSMAQITLERDQNVGDTHTEPPEVASTAEGNVDTQPPEVANTAESNESEKGGHGTGRWALNLSVHRWDDDGGHCALHYLARGRCETAYKGAQTNFPVMGEYAPPGVPAHDSAKPRMDLMRFLFRHAFITPQCWALANDHGATPLHVAAAVGNLSVLEDILLERDEKPGSQEAAALDRAMSSADADGLMPVDVAHKLGHEGAARRLGLTSAGKAEVLTASSPGSPPGKMPLSAPEMWLQGATTTLQGLTGLSVIGSNAHGSALQRASRYLSWATGFPTTIQTTLNQSTGADTSALAGTSNDQPQPNMSGEGQESVDFKEPDNGAEPQVSPAASAKMETKLDTPAAPPTAPASDVQSEQRSVSGLPEQADSEQERQDLKQDIGPPAAVVNALPGSEASTHVATREQERSSSHLYEANEQQVHSPRPGSLEAAQARLQQLRIERFEREEQERALSPRSIRLQTLNGITTTVQEPPVDGTPRYWLCVEEDRGCQPSQDACSLFSTPRCGEMTSMRGDVVDVACKGCGITVNCQWDECPACGRSGPGITDVGLSLKYTQLKRKWTLASVDNEIERSGALSPRDSIRFGA